MNLITTLKNIHKTQECCHAENSSDSSLVKKILLVGHPNVGKSVLFNKLTNSYVTVSNYPGTTVSLSKAHGILHKTTYEIIDTPGMYSFLPITEEEHVTQKILLSSVDAIVLHVIDAKNMERMLPLTLQLIEADLAVVLVLNLMDEVEQYKLSIHIKKLTQILGIPVVPIIAIKDKGLGELKDAICSFEVERKRDLFHLDYGTDIENQLKVIQSYLNSSEDKPRARSLLFLQNDSDPSQFAEPLQKKITRDVVDSTQKKYPYPLFYMIALARQQKATEITKKVLTGGTGGVSTLLDRLSNLMLQPWSGIPILMLFLYVGIYKFVGEFGAGTLVDYLEGTIFEKYLNPYFILIVNRTIPWSIIRDLFVGEYGILTLGIRYAVAIILPIVGTFFLMFAIIEDSGYLPRLAMLIDKVFKKIGLSGRAVIPMVLGLGCSTMATMVTRTLPTKRERLMATLLLALAVPCSAQLGVLMVLLAPYPGALTVWGLSIITVFFVVGYLGARLLPGEAPVFFMDIPPLRLPSVSNILIKTYARVAWYFQEVFPLFILASVFLWIGKITGVFELIISILRFPVRSIGLPDETAVAYLFGFFRRDYGAAGLYDMQKAGLFTVNQLTVAVVSMTLFPACVAQVLMMIKERGTRAGIAIFLFSITIAFFLGYMLSTLLRIFSITL